MFLEVAGDEPARGLNLPPLHDCISERVVSEHPCQACAAQLRVDHRVVEVDARIAEKSIVGLTEFPALVGKGESLSVWFMSDAVPGFDRRSFIKISGHSSSIRPNRRPTPGGAPTGQHREARLDRVVRYAE